MFLINKTLRRILIPAAVLLLFIFLFYGPFEKFRLLWINTAIYSSRFKFLATSLYTKKYIDKVIAQNEPAKYRITDNSVLKNEWNDKISFTEIKGEYYKGYVIKINDPSRLFFVQSNNAEGTLLEQFAKECEAAGGINASGYSDPKLRGGAWGAVIIKDRFICKPSRREHHIMGGFNEEYKLVVGRFTEEEIMEQKYLWAFEFGPLYIVNCEKMELTSYSGGYSPRSAIGQTAQGHILLVAVDGRQANSIGATFQDMQEILFNNGAVNAIGLDGGSSTTIVYQGEVVNSPSEGKRERLLPNAILFR